MSRRYEVTALGRLTRLRREGLPCGRPRHEQERRDLGSLLAGDLSLLAEEVSLQPLLETGKSAFTHTYASANGAWGVG